MTCKMLISAMVLILNPDYIISMWWRLDEVEYSNNRDQ